MWNRWLKLLIYIYIGKWVFFIDLGLFIVTDNIVVYYCRNVNVRQLWNLLRCRLNVDACNLPSVVTSCYCYLESILSFFYWSCFVRVYWWHCFSFVQWLLILLQYMKRWNTKRVKCNVNFVYLDSRLHFVSSFHI